MPRKNIRPFAGRPMIAHAIGTALRSGLFAHVIVSTDDEEIAAVARDAGATTPFMRPAALADDLTGTVPVIAHAIEDAVSRGLSPLQVCCIYPCVPFLTPDDLIAGEQSLRSTGADYVYPVTEYPHPVQRAMRRLESGQMQFLQPEFEMSPTHVLEKTFHDTGQFYWGTADAWRAHKRMHTAGVGFVVPKYRVVDIDTLDDWHRAELLWQVQQTQR